MINKTIYFIVCFLLFLCIYLSAVKKTPFVEEGFTLQKAYNSCKRYMRRNSKNKAAEYAHQVMKAVKPFIPGM